MFKSVRVSEKLHRSAEVMAEVMHRSTASQIEFWASIGRNAEALLDPATLHLLLKAKVVDDAQAISLENSRKLDLSIKNGLIDASAALFLSGEAVKDAKVKFNGHEF